MLKLAKRLELIQPSATLGVASLARRLRAEGRHIIALNAGEPDFETPEAASKGAAAAIETGATRYTAVEGTEELREAIRAKVRERNSLEYQTDEIVVSCGAKHSIHNALAVLLDPGDKVVVPAPYWVSYPDMVRLNMGQATVVECPLEQGFKIKPEQLEQALDDRTKLLILNSPCNPSGKAYSGDELRELARVLVNYPKVAVISDEIYETTLFEGKFCSLVEAAPELRERSILIKGVSKSHAMTGWRIGYSLSDRKVAAAITKIQSQTITCACSVAQAAAAAALSLPDRDLDYMKTAYRNRHDLLVGRLSRIPGIGLTPADGAFYLLVRVDGLYDRFEPPVTDDLDFAGRLIEQLGVAVVPGTPFGARHHIRISYAAAETEIEAALKKFEQHFGSR